MIYTLSIYKEVFHPTKSERTVRRMLKSGLIPSNHKIIGRTDKQFVIDVMTVNENAAMYLEKAIEFQKLKSKTIHDAVSFCIINNLSVTLFVKIVGV